MRARNLIAEARERVRIKRALRLAGVAIPARINFNLAALKRLREETAAPVKAPKTDVGGMTESRNGGQRQGGLCP